MHDRQKLEADWRAGKRPKLLSFWGHQPSKDGSVTASCFSQWWPAPFTVDGETYPTAEH
ncbi:NADAR family protein, partial [Salmonella enterica subsp. enterica serovar Enteritidis]|nr:NADAR family protein [Salmonella enterica subsp. enterica serovar Enteritidis]